MTALSDEQIAANTTLLEELFLHRNPQMPYAYTHSYREDRMHQMLDVAIATVAQYTPKQHVYEIAEAEEIDDVDLLRLIRVIASLWQNVGYLTDPARNILYTPENPDWQTALRHRLATMLAEQGRVMTDDDRTYSWLDTEIDGRPRVHAVLTVWEDNWSEFDGTFVDNSDHHGLSGIVLLEDRTVHKMRYETDLGDMIRQAVSSAPTRYYGGTGWL